MNSYTGMISQIRRPGNCMPQRWWISAASLRSATSPSPQVAATPLDRADLTSGLPPLLCESLGRTGRVLVLLGVLEAVAARFCVHCLSRDSQPYFRQVHLAPVLIYKRHPREVPLCVQGVVRLSTLLTNDTA